MLHLPTFPTFPTFPTSPTFFTLRSIPTPQNFP
jgi:hypothetical protein